jgi:putative ABC transport system permease protein
MSLMLTRMLRGLLFGVSAMDPLTVLTVAAVLLLVAVAASYLPARKAMLTDPMVSIREH